MPTYPAVVADVGITVRDTLTSVIELFCFDLARNLRPSFVRPRQRYGRTRRRTGDYGEGVDIKPWSFDAEEQDGRARRKTAISSRRPGETAENGQHEQSYRR